MLLGALAVIVGSLLLLERYGVIPDDVQWGAPIVIIFFGVASIYSAMKGKPLDEEDGKVDP